MHDGWEDRGDVECHRVSFEELACLPVDRRFSLYAHWAAVVIARLGFLPPLILAYLVTAENVDDEGVKLLAYVAAFYTAIGLLGAMSAAVMGYVHCVSVLRQAEAD